MSQSHNNTFRIASPTDAQILQMFETVSDGNQFSVRIANASLGSFSKKEEFLEHLPNRNWNNTRDLTSLEVELPQGTYLHFHRSVTTFGSQNLITPDEWENEIYFFHPNGRVPTEEALRITEVIDAYKQGTSTKPGKQISREVSQMFARQMASLADLQSQIIVEAERARHQREAEYEERLRVIEAEAAARRAKEDEQHQLKQAELSATAQRLAEREAEIDDRSHMHARREMRERITVELRERLKRPPISDNASKLRFRIQFVCYFLISTFIFSSVYSAFELNQVMLNPAVDLRFYLSIARLTASLAAVGLIGLYLLGWLRRIHDDDVKSERDLERYLYDVDRASWAIDTILEAKSRDTDGKQADIPAEWIQGATHGLFARTEPKDEDKAAIEALGALLNFAAEAKFGPSGPEFKITKRGLAQARKSGLLTDES